MSRNLKTALVTTVVALGFLQPRIGFAQDARIGIVNTDRLLRGSDEGKMAEDKVMKRFNALSSELDKARRDIEGKETRLREQDRLMSATVKSQLTREIEDDKRRFDRKNEDYQKEVSELENSLLAPLSDKIQSVVAALVSEKGFTILVDLATQQSNVVWANPGNDITNDAMKRLNDAYKTSQAAAPAAAAPAAAAPDAAAPANPQR